MNAVVAIKRDMLLICSSIIGDEYSMAAGQIRKLFSPLIINSDGLCEVCEKPNKKG